MQEKKPKVDPHISARLDNKNIIPIVFLVDQL